VKRTAVIGIFLLALTLTVQGQQQAVFKTPFPDSVRIVLENTRNLDATTVGAAFSGIWGTLGLDHQRAVMRQARVLQKKGYKLRPHLVNYFGAIADAINLEQADPAKLNGFLAVADKVIQYEDPNKANQFFSAARDFFEHHALYYSRSYHLLAKDDDYQFDYIPGAYVPLPGDTTSAVNNQFKQWDNNQSDQNTTWQDPPADTVAQNPDAPPSWMQTTPPPALTGAVIKFTRVTLNFSTPYDSTFLKGSKGSFSLRDRIFVGEGGTFDWSSTGLSGDSVYAEMTSFFFNANKPAFKCEVAKLTYKGKIAARVPGIFEFVSQRHKDPRSATYPRFMSFQCNVKVEGLGGSQTNYQGGFSLNGRRIFSTCANGEYSTIEVMGKTDRKFSAQSRLFEFQDSVISSKQTRIILYQGNDSIYHPSMGLRYDFGKGKLALQKERSPLKDAPFSSSYFRMDFNADQIKWDLTSDSLNVYTAGGRSQQPLIIQSVDYYNPDDYQILAGHGFNFHPLGVVVGYSTATGLREFYSDDIAQRFQLKPQEVRMAMQYLSSKGMIRYNPTTSLVQVGDKAIHFQEASRGKTDYDNIKIHSVVDGPANATLNLNRGDITVRGVDEFNVSDSLNVVIKPDSSVVKLLQNRDIKFNGKITAGNFEINGKDFTLKYDSFFINLNHIDSIRFYVTEKNSKGQMIRRRVNNAMVGADSVAAAAAGGLMAGSKKTSGTLFINVPDNKSGLKKVPNYPRLDATAGGVIYFDRREVLDGAYDRSVFFVVPPFKLDSLNDADPASINFEGTFVSSGMFPSFKEKLHTMADKSLGFTHSVPLAGYPLYHGEGKLYGGMSLDNAGIRATGRIEYLAAGVEADDFIFYPDSVVGVGKVGSLKEKQFGPVWFPQADFTDFKLKWLPKQDRFNLTNLRDPFNFYNSTARLNGQLTVSKKGVSGQGKLVTRGSELISEELAFSARDFSARHAQFQVKTSNPDKPALAGDDISLRFDLEKNYADISPEVEGVAAITFPYAQFKTSITDARWDLNTQKITMAKDKDVPIENSYFYTTRKDLDSLVFNAEKAEYDIQSQQLKVSGIPYIVVADAQITPDNNEVLILENSQIGQLKNTTIVLDTLNGYHRLTDGVVNIVSRKEFNGYATYQYVNAISDTFAIKMTDFHLENIVDAGVRERRHASNGESVHQQTVANGAVDEKENLILAPRIYYKGDMVMYATKPALQLRGYVKLDLRKIKNYHTWIKYEQSGDEKEVYLDFDNALTEDGAKAEAGLHYQADNSLYITFVSDKRSADDEDFFLPSGSLYFDQESSEFKIEDRRKAAGEKLSGKVLAYNEEKQEVRFEGPVSFFKGSQDFNLSASVLGSGNVETNDIRMNAFVLCDMNVPLPAMQQMALQLQDVIKNEGAQDGLGDQTELLYKVANLVDERIARDYEQKSQQNYVSLSTIQELARPLAFANVSLKWSQKHKAFYSEGLLGLSHSGRMDVNGGFEGFMEVRKNEDGSPVFHVFFKASPEAWYYFGYEDNRLMMHSSNPAFNEIVSKKTNASKAKIGQLVFIPGSDEETLAFITRFRQRYYENEAPYDLSGTTSSKKKDKKKDDKEDDGF